MAEIKSTMDMVLERAARMAATASSDDTKEDLEKKGMRLAAEFLKGGDSDLVKSLMSQPPGEQMSIRRGMAQTLLRNVVLPRDEELQKAGKIALQAISALGGKSQEIDTICRELGQILDQYGQHKEQMTQQLEDAIRGQLQQMAKGRGNQENLNPAMHPQYREELTRMLTGLNNQYTDALNQRKELIFARFSPTQTS